MADVHVGVDVGGTFTDVVCWSRDKPLKIFKVPSTPKDPSAAVLTSVKVIADRFGIPQSDLKRFVHGTTVGTNAVLERKGAKIGILTTEGFKDTLEIGRQLRQAMYDLILAPETPGFLAPGGRRKEVQERVSSRGDVVRPLDEASVKRAVDELVASGVEGIAVCYLFSFLNPSHEKQTWEIISRHYPDLAKMTSLSSEVDPSFREYERTVVTAFDAYIKPKVSSYLEGLEDGLAAAGVPAPLQLMQSRGGVAVSSVARSRPVRLFLSGPAAGVIGARMAGRLEGIEDVIGVDIGGTSCDIALVTSGKPNTTAEGVIGGYPVRVSMVDVNTIGSGGGSIAWLDKAGGLRVGPHSAGADPGPACYGLGGKEATVTDASIVLGYIDPNYFAGGSLRLQPKLASEAVEAKVAKLLGLSLPRAALGIHRVLNAQMAEGIRLVSIRRGYDPRKFTLVPCGGGGGVHAIALAEELNIKRIIIPRYPGVLSAMGLLDAPIEHEVSAGFPSPVEKLDLNALKAALHELDRKASELMSLENVPAMDVRIKYYADVFYKGQSYSIEVPLNLEVADPIAQLYEDFVAEHNRVYGHSTRSPASLVNLRTVHQSGGDGSKEDVPYKSSGKPAVKGTRQILLSADEGYVVAKVYDRDALEVGREIIGPAIIEQADTTTVLANGWTGVVAGSGAIILTSQP